MKGLNYRDQAKPCTEEALKSVKTALKSYCDKYLTPVGVRSITSGTGRGSSLQQLSVYLSICIKSMLHSAKNRSIYDNQFHVRNDYFDILIIMNLF